MTINVEFYEDISGCTQKMRYFQKKKMRGRGQAPQAPSLDPQLQCLYWAYRRAFCPNHYLAFIASSTEKGGGGGGGGGGVLNIPLLFLRSCWQLCIFRQFYPPPPHLPETTG